MKLSTEKDNILFMTDNDTDTEQECGDTSPIGSQEKH